MFASVAERGCVSLDGQTPTERRMGGVSGLHTPPRRPRAPAARHLPPPPPSPATNSGISRPTPRALFFLPSFLLYHHHRRHASLSVPYNCVCETYRFFLSLLFIFNLTSCFFSIRFLCCVDAEKKIKYRAPREFMRFFVPARRVGAYVPPVRRGAAAGGADRHHAVQVKRTRWRSRRVYRYSPGNGSLCRLAPGQRSLTLSACV